MNVSIAELVKKANEVVKVYSVADAGKLVDGDNTVFIDVRDEPELSESGKIPGSVNVSRGMLEFRIDPDSPYHDPIFAAPKEFVFYCASGGRSALAAERAKEMGLINVAHVEGGIKAWIEAGQSVEKL